MVYQIDAYNYNQWGTALGEILSIGKDVISINNKPFFKVKCQIDQKYLTLENGVKGRLKKGMTLTAQFILAERSLYDLLYDGVNDWLNPANG